MKTTRLALFSGVILLVGTLAFSAIAKQRKVVYAKGDVRSYLHQLGGALQMYASDYDDVMPLMQDAKKFQELMAPYVKDKKYLTDPHTGQPFTPNARLSGKALNDLYRETFKTKQPVVAIYQAVPSEGGARFVLFLPQPIMMNKNQPVWKYNGTYNSQELKIVSVSYNDWKDFKTKAKLP